MNKSLEFDELEQVYELIADAIDCAGQESEVLFLSKLCITLAHRVGDLQLVEDAIHIASDGQCTAHKAAPCPGNEKRGGTP